MSDRKSKKPSPVKDKMKSRKSKFKLAAPLDIPYMADNCVEEQPAPLDD